ncbi:hypothetical protein Tco_1382171, partial [Tanacetum coccineum]
VIEEGKPVDAVGSGVTTSAIGAMTSGAGRSTLDGGLSNSSNNGKRIENGAKMGIYGLVSIKSAQ